MGFLLDVGLDYLSLSPLGRHAGRWRGAAHPAGVTDRQRPGRRALRARRAVDRPAPARQPPADRDADAAARPRQHGAGRRARRGDDPGRRPRRRHRARRGRARRRRRVRGPGQGPARRRRSRSPASTCPGKRSIPVPGAAPRAGQRRGSSSRAPASTTCATSTSTFPLGMLRRGHRRVGLGQVDARQRHPRAGADAAHLQVEACRPGCTSRSTGIEHLDKVINIDQSPIGRTPRSNPATYTGVFDHIRKLFAQTQEAKVRGYLPGPVQLQRQGRPVRGVRGRRHDQDRDALPARRVRAVRGVQGRPLQPRHARHHVPGQEHRRVLDLSCEEALRVLRQPAGHRPPHADARRRRPRLRAARASRRPRCPAARRSG